MLARFSKIKYIAAYIEHKKDELAKFNQQQEVDESSLVNGRRMTNVGTFRAYIVAYLEKSSQSQPGDDIFGATTAAARTRLTDRNLRLLQRYGMGELRGDSGRYF